MLRTLALVSLVALLTQGPAVQDGRSLVTVKVALTDSDGKPVPVPRHVLLVSDNPPAGSPRRIRTAPDGTVSVRLSPGNYTVESEEPVTFQGRAYEWMRIIDIAPGRDVALELTGANAVVAVATPSTGGASSLDDDPSMLLAQWQDSVVEVWSPTARATGFLIDARGVIVTNQRAVGSASSVEVQLTPAAKLPGRVLQADPVRDVAVLRIDPKAAASVRPVSLACTQPGAPGLKDGQEIIAIVAPLRRPKRAASAAVSGIEGRVIKADFAIGEGGAGGPVFAAGARLVGITSLTGPNEDGSGGGDTQVIRIEEVCAAVAAAEPKVTDADVPEGVNLPVEPERPFPRRALEEAAERTAFSLTPYRMSSSSFDVTFITPLLMYAAEGRRQQASGRGQADDRGTLDPRTIDPLDEFSNWSAYVADYPPVLMIRVTPKLVEGFWTKVARGAARTQGVSLPPIKRFKPGFGRLRAFCGEAEVTPVHPFKLEQRVSETDAVYEGLYVFDPGALGPACGTVRLVIYSERDPQKGETRPVDAAVLRRIWDDFAPYRSLA
jgi:S1-C subfamily serine protease